MPVNPVPGLGLSPLSAGQVLFSRLLGKRSRVQSMGRRWSWRGECWNSTSSRCEPSGGTRVDVCACVRLSGSNETIEQGSQRSHMPRMVCWARDMMGTGIQYLCGSLGELTKHVRSDRNDTRSDRPSAKPMYMCDAFCRRIVHHGRALQSHLFRFISMILRSAGDTKDSVHLHHLV